MKAFWSVVFIVGLAVISLQPRVYAETASSSTLVEVGNKICPVSGEKVGKMGDPIQEEYNGKLYNLCCSMCVKDFKKDPEKYSRIAEAEVSSGTHEESMMHEAEEVSHGMHGGDDYHGHDHHEHDHE